MHNENPEITEHSPQETTQESPETVQPTEPMPSPATDESPVPSTEMPPPRRTSRKLFRIRMRCRMNCIFYRCLTVRFFLIKSYR